MARLCVSIDNLLTGMSPRYDAERSLVWNGDNFSQQDGRRGVLVKMHQRGSLFPSSSSKGLMEANLFALLARSDVHIMIVRQSDTIGLLASPIPKDMDQGKCERGEPRKLAGCFVDDLFVQDVMES